jgi:ribulose-phosphate 3-epimerase
VLIHPSILSADFLNLESELATISEADAIHVDVMDNNFVPNLTFGQKMVDSLSKRSALPLDLHLMIENADKWAPEFAKLGASSVTFHVEASENPIITARAIKAEGVKAAIAIKPGTPFGQVEELLTEFDMLLVMTVEPGFGGQKLLEETLPKIAQARSHLRAHNLQIGLQVDGGVTESNIAQLAELGADVFVAGSAIFSFEDRNEKIRQLRGAALKGH